MSDVYVLGVDMIKFGRFPDRTVPNIGAEAALMALDDADLSIKDMQAMYCGNLGQANAMVGQRILQEIGRNFQDCERWKWYALERTPAMHTNLFAR